MLPPTRCALTAPFHPCRQRISALLGRFAFCCTFRGLAPPRRYLAPYPPEPGLSSISRVLRYSDCLAGSRLGKIRPYARKSTTNHYSLTLELGAFRMTERHGIGFVT